LTEDTIFSDGIAEDIITGLARFHSLFVVARNFGADDDRSPAIESALPATTRKRCGAHQGHRYQQILSHGRRAGERRKAERNAGLMIVRCNIFVAVQHQMR
jgi:TolB-like protein